VWKAASVDDAQYLDAIRREGDRIRDLSSRDVKADVESCEGWTMADLLGHLTRVYRMVTSVLETNEVPERRSEDDADADPAARFSESFDALLATMAVTDPGVERWNWSVGPQEASFWWRRMAHETAVHRWDAESAFGECAPIEADLAADGIDEWFDAHVRSDAADPDNPGDALGTIHVHCADVDGEWWASLTDRRLDLERAHRKGDVAVRGDASDLLLVLWGRADPSTVEVMGDDQVLRSWLAVPDI
jgi:uncharacterized protein (TIGR03083 family)